MRVLLILLCLAMPAKAEEIVLGLSQDQIGITAFFDGSEILVYGAVKHGEGPVNPAPLDVIIAIAGPSEPVTVRRKERRFGIWVNTEAVEVDLAPSFYAVATSAPLATVLTETEDLRHKITVDKAIRSVGAPMTVTDSAAFSTALIRIREDASLYKTLENTVQFEQQTLFSTSVALPANLTEGDYATRIFLTRDGQVIADYETDIAVRKVGMEQFLYNLAHQQPLIYGVLSLIIAIAAGWGAAAAFRAIRG